jgi:hypothetical protein
LNRGTNSGGAEMIETGQIRELDRSILDMLSHYESLSLQGLWCELEENDDLNLQSISRAAVLGRLEFLSTIGFVKFEGDKWVARK